MSTDNHHHRVKFTFFERFGLFSETNAVNTFTLIRNEAVSIFEIRTLQL